jgi:hypothetical protein
MERVQVAAEERYDITGLPTIYCVSHGRYGILFTEEPAIEDLFILSFTNIQDLVTYFLTRLDSLHSHHNHKIPTRVRQQFINAVNRFVDEILKEVEDDDQEWDFAKSFRVDMTHYNGPWDSFYCPPDEEEPSEEIPIEDY